MNLTQWETALKILISVTTLWGVVWKLRPVIAAWREKRAEHWRQLTNLVAQCQSMEQSLSAIQRELRPNGGSSLRDVVNTIRDQQALERVARRSLTGIPSIEYVEDRDGETHVLYVSPAYVQLTGLTREDIQDRGWMRAVRADDREWVSEAHTYSRAEKTVFVATYTIQHVHHAHQRVLVEHIDTPVFSVDGHCVGWVAVLRPASTS